MPGIRPVIHDDHLEGWSCSHGFLLPFGHRHSLLGHPLPAGELGPPHGRLTGQRPDPDGVAPFRTHELRPDWVPSEPRGQRCSSRPRRLPVGRRPHPSSQSLHPAALPTDRGRITRHQRGFTQFTRPVFPSPVTARMEQAALGLEPRASHPADQEPTTHARVGTGHRARTWNYRSTHIRQSPIR